MKFGRSQQLQVLRSTEESGAADFAKKGKSKDTLEIKDTAELSGTPNLSQVTDLLGHLQKVAKTAAGAALKEFYGCPKCRNSRAGCIWWRCNPVKLQAHFAKFPEKYGADGKVRKPKVAAKITDEEMLV